MFKHKAKKTIGATIIGLLAARSIASGSVISGLANLYSKAKEMDTLKDTFGPGNIGGIYQNHLDIEQDNALVGGAEAIEYILNQYKTSKACRSNKSIITMQTPLKKTDIIAILLYDNPDIGWIPSDLASQGKKDSIKKSCEKLLTCMGKTQLDYTTCTKTIHNTHKHYQAQSQKQQEMISGFYGTQFFNNGTLDDSTYDLVVDIQLIGDIMFGDNKKPTQTLYYRMPTASKGPAVTPPTNTSTPSTTISKKGTTGTTDNIKKQATGTTGNKTDSNDKTDSQAPSNNDKDTQKNTQGSSNKTKKSSSITTEKPNTSQRETTTGSPLFGNNICIDQSTDTENNSDQIDKADSSPNPFVDTSLTPEEISTMRQSYLQTINGSYTSYKPTDSIPSTPLPPRGEGDEGETDTIDANTEGMNMIEKVASCMADCKKSYSGTDMLICQASCMCDTAPTSPQEYSKYLDFSIKFCRVPTKDEAPHNSTITVHSIEEIVDNINTTLTALKQSGALNKRNETQEYLDTTLRNMNIADSFVFSFNIAFKTSPNTKNEKTKQSEVDQAYDDIVSSSMIYKKDNQKYDLGKKPKAEEQNIKHKQMIMENAITRQEILLENILALDEFWRHVEMQMREVHKIALNMKTKAENAE